MRSQLLVAALSATVGFGQGVVAAPSCQTTYCNPSHEVSGSQLRTLFNAFVDQFYHQRDFQGAMDKYTSPNLIQHNPQIANGSQAQVDAVVGILANYDGPEFEIVIVDEQKGYAAVFNRFRGKAGTGLPVAGVTDIYRFEGSCMVEHWDDIESLPANSTNPNPFK